MPADGHRHDSEGDVARPVRQRKPLLARARGDAETTPLGNRLRNLVLKPVEAGMVSDEAAGRRPTVEELEADVRSANDKERLIGLVAAPLAAVVGILVISTLIVNDPPARLSNGQIDTLHVSLSLYYDLGAVILGLAVLMLVTAMWRKRLYLGIVTALFGLAIFNLHYWGFGVPFILLSSWLLVRAYRLQRDLRAAGEDGLLRAGTQNEGRSTTPPRSSPKPSSRYTPPAAAPRRSSAPRPGNRQRAR